MKILVVSDNHGDYEIIEKIVQKFKNQVNLICHCGDSESLLSDPINQQMAIVKGNMDFESFDNNQLIEIEDKKILLTHGHKENVNQGMLSLELLAKSYQADVVLFGHTHQLQAIRDDGILFVNPGSISYPRGVYQNLKGTFAIIEECHGSYQVQYYNRELLPIDDLKLEFS
ncbi:metallophosphoesterase [Lentilactobacillus laojiaonis]|uniref:metallophosphoesterase n=1 Tax=Lentilactobacillus laojiaonis TaxID=2883998 RepID=UPI001D09FE27|nr:metallophosphoesterase [Lentilactobacillus laojiaonis]UDM31694.1 metallophosphoesterase [Lentilactobacillus laojiaonis]